VGLRIFSGLVVVFLYLLYVADMKILIVGYGSIGRRHFRNLLALGERDILFLRSKRSTLPDAEIADYPVETELEAALQHSPDGVIVANPTAFHLDVAIPAAEVGCHLLLEKPISHSLERLDELQQAVERGGGKVLVGFQFRYHPQLKQIATLLSAGEIGRPISVRVHWGEFLPGWHPWEDYKVGYSARKDLGGGVVLTLCHPLDYLRWLLGEIDELWAFVSQVEELRIDVEASAEIGLRFRNGATGTVHLDYIQRPHKHSFEIIGAEGTIFWDYIAGSLQVFRAGSNGSDVTSLPENYDRNHLFVDLMKNFLAVIRDEQVPQCSLLDGIQAQELAMAVIDSNRHKRMVRIDNSFNY